MKITSFIAVVAVTLGAASALANPAARVAVVDVADLERRSGGIEKRCGGPHEKPCMQNKVPTVDVADLEKRSGGIEKRCGGEHEKPCGANKQ